MSEQTITFVTGHIELGRPLGWRQDPDGYWSQEYTPTRHFDGNGICYLEVPWDGGMVRFGGSADDLRRAGQVVLSELPPVVPWWKFWGKVA